MTADMSAQRELSRSTLHLWMADTVDFLPYAESFVQVSPVRHSTPTLRVSVDAQRGATCMQPLSP